MAILLVQLVLMGLNLFFANEQTKQGKNPGLNYFVAGFCCMGAVHVLVNLLS